MSTRLSPLPGTVHFLDEIIHYRYDNSLPPAISIDSGDIVTMVCREACDGQLTPDSTEAVLDDLDWDRVHALTGPVEMRGAVPGDTLKVEILEFGHHGWGWSSVIPNFGLLRAEFGDTKRVRIWTVEEDGRANFAPGVKVPIEPFMGEMGVAWAEPGPQPTMPPTIHGGNMDCRHTGVGCTAYFPVKVAGALFSTGDGHLAQGDGEVAGIAIEAPLDVTMRFSLIKGMEIPAARFETSGPTTSKYDGEGYYVTCGTGPDLHTSVEDAVRLMIDTLERERGFDRADAYIICSVACDLKIAVPVLGDGHASHVTFHAPKSIFV